MRVDTLKSSTSGGGLGPDGGTMLGPLTLSRDPLLALEAATKQYVDNSASSLNAGSFVTNSQFTCFIRRCY